MTNLISISPENLIIQPHQLWNDQWLLLTSGDFSRGHFNAMTVGWGSIGTMWNKPFAQIVVRPTRYTFEFMEQYSTFTLCAFPREYQDDLLLLGTRSGRDGDKMSATGLKPTAASSVASPVYEQAELCLECKKTYWQDFRNEHFLEKDTEAHYPDKDYHRSYFGEIIAVQGIPQYSKR